MVKVIQDTYLWNKWKWLFEKKKKVKPLSDYRDGEYLTIDTGEDIFYVYSKRVIESVEVNDHLHVGNHAACGSPITFRDMGKYKIVLCDHCCLRIKVPSHIVTAEELKKYLDKCNIK